MIRIQRIIGVERLIGKRLSSEKMRKSCPMDFAVHRLHSLTFIMPFNADTRAGLFSLELNISCVVEELEQLRERYLHNDMGYEEGSVVWRYVMELENAYSSHMNSTISPIDFWKWFLDNYNSVETYDDLVWEECDCEYTKLADGEFCDKCGNRKEETEETWKETCEECGCLMGGKIFTDEEEFDECEDRDRGYDELGNWYCKDYDKQLGKCLKLY